MSDNFEKEEGRQRLQDFRDELGDQFVRAATREASGSRTSQRLRRGGLVLLAAAIAVPAAIAAENELGGSTTRVLVPAEPPAEVSGSTADPACPEEARNLVFDVLAGQRPLSDYRQSPGYPVEGCPTAENLESLVQANGP